MRLCLLSVFCATAYLSNFPAAVADAVIDLEIRSYVSSSNRNLDSREPVGGLQVWLDGETQLDDRVFLQWEGWVGGETGADGVLGDLREAQVSFRGNAVDLTIGRQLIVWGKTDRINPTDIVGPRDYTAPMPEDADQRMGQSAARIDWLGPDLTVSAYWLPEFRASRVPIAERPTVILYGLDHEDWDPEQWALRVAGAGGAVDWSLYSFFGYQRMPSLRLQAVGPTSITVEAFHPRQRMIGADLALPLVGWNARGELAYIRSNDGRDNGQMKMVIGADRDIGGETNLNIQYVFSHTSEHRDPNRLPTIPERDVEKSNQLLLEQHERNRHGATFRVAKNWMNGILRAELGSAYFFSDESGLVQPRVTYIITDRMSVSGGADLYFGPSSTPFGYLRENRLGFLEGRYSF